MKQLLSIILGFCLLMSLAACNTNNDGNNKDPISTETENIPQEGITSDETGNTNEESRIDLMYTFEDARKPVVFDYPNSKLIEEGTSRVFKNSKYIIVYCKDNKQVELNKIIDELTENFKSATSTHLEGEFDSFSITNTEKKTVNQTDLLLVNGKVIAKYDDGSSIQLPLYGYTFARDDAVFELLAVLNEETNDPNQKEMENTLDAMIATLREAR